MPEIEKNGVAIDPAIARRIAMKLISKETINIKTKNKSDSQMVKEIQNLIQEELKCY